MFCPREAWLAGHSSSRNEFERIGRLRVEARLLPLRQCCLLSRQLLVGKTASNECLLTTEPGRWTAGNVKLLLIGVGIGFRRPLPPVGSRTGARVWLNDSAVPRFQPPPRRTQRADFPHCAPPFASCRGLWDLSCRGDFRHVASHPIAAKQLQSVVQPRPTPPLPAEALSFPSMRQMAPDLLLHPIFDEASSRSRLSTAPINQSCRLKHSLECPTAK